jgi:branched-chain amino acid transport system permease protein
VRGLARKVSWVKVIVGVVLAALVLAVPQQYEAFQVRRFTTVVVFAIAVLGLNLLTGFNGQISLGHGAFYGVGAYTTAILVADHGWPHLATVPVAAVLSFFVGCLAGIPALRIRGLYLALTTLALATVFPTLIQHFSSITGGTQGKPVTPYTSPIDGLANDQWAYYVAVAFAAVVFLLVRNLVRSRVGRSLIAIRDNEVAAEVVGVNLAMYKVATFGTSAMIAGLAGSLSVFLLKDFGYIAARDFTIALSISFLVAMVIGGAASIVGPIIGALFIERAPTFITDTLKFDASLTNIIYGALLILLMFLMPGGVVGLWHRLSGIVRRRTGRGGSVAAADAAFANPEDLAREVAPDDPQPSPA